MDVLKVQTQPLTPFSRQPVSSAWTTGLLRMRSSYGRPGLLRHLMNNTDDGPCAQLQLMHLMHRLQVPLDGPYGQPAFLPQGRYKADQADPQPLRPTATSRGGPGAAYVSGTADTSR